MATYAENAYQRELKAQRAAQDKFLAARHATFDAEVAQQTDKRGGWKTMKYERPSFTVVTASEAFRAGYDQIDWSKGEDDHGLRSVVACRQEHS